MGLFGGVVKGSGSDTVSLGEGLALVSLLEGFFSFGFWICRSSPIFKSAARLFMNDFHRSSGSSSLLAGIWRLGDM